MHTHVALRAIVLFSMRPVAELTDSCLISITLSLLQLYQNTRHHWPTKYPVDRARKARPQHIRKSNVDGTRGCHTKGKLKKNMKSKYSRTCKSRLQVLQTANARETRRNFLATSSSKPVAGIPTAQSLPPVRQLQPNRVPLHTACAPFRLQPRLTPAVIATFLREHKRNTCNT